MSEAATTTTDRQAKFREKRKAEGYKFIQVWLPADVAELLKVIATGNEISQTDAVIEAIRQCYEQMPY